MIEGLKNAVIIDGVVYEFIDDSRPDECMYCDLRKKCEHCMCFFLFNDVEGKRFKKRTDL